MNTVEESAPNPKPAPSGDSHVTRALDGPGVADQSNALQKSLKRPGKPGMLDWRIAIVVLLCLISIPAWRATTGHARLTPKSNSPTFPVAVCRVTREDLAEELVCEAELRPWQEVDLHAKVAGYLEKINVDIGDLVKSGQLLATLEVPELKDDITRSAAAFKRSEQEAARAQAAYEEAHLAYTRLKAVDKAQPNLIAQQDLDVAQAKELTTGSALAAAKAEVDVANAEICKLRTMLKYCSIEAPFSGVITERYADPGALIQAGTSSSTQTLPLVRLSQNDRLRLDIPIPVSCVSRIHTGDTVDVRVDSLGEKWTGTIARRSGKVETATRTMKVEVDVSNSGQKLVPGMYATVVLRPEHHDHTLVLPVEAVSRRKTCSVWLVNGDHKIEERTISVGLETPHKIEVLAGLHENDLVMIGSHTQVNPGQLVEPKLITEPQATE